jgi:hypothetical protein
MTCIFHKLLSLMDTKCSCTDFVHLSFNGQLSVKVMQVKVIIHVAGMQLSFHSHDLSKRLCVSLISSAQVRICARKISDGNGMTVTASASCTMCSYWDILQIHYTWEHGFSECIRMSV